MRAIALFLSAGLLVACSNPTGPVPVELEMDAFRQAKYNEVGSIAFPDSAIRRMDTGEPVPYRIDTYREGVTDSSTPVGSAFTGHRLTYVEPGAEGVFVYAEGFGRVATGHVITNRDSVLVLDF